MKRYAKGGMSDADRKAIAKYRKEPRYHGYEDYSPSGRVAMYTYNANQKTNDIVRNRGDLPYSKSAAKKAQAAQRQYNAELRRETKHTVPAEELAKGGKVRGCGIARKGLTKGKMR